MMATTELVVPRSMPIILPMLHLPLRRTHIAPWPVRKKVFEPPRHPVHGVQ
jgi:hypothetical protein